MKFLKLFFRAAFQKFFKGHPFPELLEYSTVASEEESDSSNEDHSKSISCFDDLGIAHHDSKSQPIINSYSNLTKTEEKFIPNMNLSTSTELEKEKMIIELELEEISSDERTSNEDHITNTCFDDEGLEIVLDSKSQPVNSDFNLSKAVNKMTPNKDFSSTRYGDNEDKSIAKYIAEKNLDELEKEKRLIELELEEMNSKHKSQFRNLEMQLKMTEESRDATENLSHNCVLCHEKFLLLTNLYKHMENCVKYYPQ